MGQVFFGAPQPVFLAAAPSTVHANATLTSNSSAVQYNVSQYNVLIINITGAPTGGTPTLQFTVQDVDPVDGTTLIGSAATSNTFSAAGTQTLAFPSTTGAVKVSWALTGSTPSFTGVNVSIAASSVSAGSNASVGLVNNAAPGSATFVGGLDETTGHMLPVCLGPDGHVAVTQDTLAGFAGAINVWTTDSHTPPLTDVYGAQYVRGQVMTDEGSYTDDFSTNTLAIAMTGTVDFTNGSVNITGTGTKFLSELNYYSLIKKSADGETLWVAVSNVIDDTHATLVSAYTGTTQSGQAAVTSVWQTTTGASGGAGIAVANSVATISAGTAAVKTGFYMIGDYLPFIGTMKAVISQRITNQSIFVGFFDNIASPGLTAGFLFDGATNTTVKCQTSSTSSANDTQTTPITLPGGVNSAASNVYQVIPRQGNVAFLVNGQQVAVHTQHVVPPYADIRFGVYASNAAVVTATTVGIDLAVLESLDRLDVQPWNSNPDVLQVTANGKTTTTGLALPIPLKPASTAAAATDPAVVVAVSPNNTVAITSATAANTKVQAVGISLAMVDAASNTELVVQTQDFPFGYNGSTWDRLRSGSVAADTATASTMTAGYLGVASYLYGYDGSTNWQRLRMTAANGLLVDVSRVTGTVSIQGTGTAGTPAGNLLTVQGVTGMTPLKVDGSGVTQPVSGTFWQATQPVSAASLPLPTGAATETTLGTRLAEATFTGRINTQGQKTMAASTPVVIASDQAAFSVTSVRERLATGNALATASMTTASSAVAASNANRRKFILRNTSTTVPVYIAYGVTATTSAPFVLQPGQVYVEDTEVFTGAINGITASGTATVAVQELQS